MTLVAGVVFEGVYMLIADALLYNDESGWGHVDLPSGKKTKQLPGSQSFFLKQKIKLVNDYVAVAYSTDEWGKALAGIEILKKLCGSDMASSGDVEKFLEILKDPKFEGLSLIGLAMLKDGNETIFSNEAKGDARIQSFEACFFSGSGSVDFANTVADRFPPVSLEGEPFHRAISSATSLMSTFYTREIHSRADEAPSPLSLFYGGAWEHAYIKDGRVKKLGDTTYAFWSVVEGSDGLLDVAGPSLILKREYIGGTLVLRCLPETRGIVTWDRQRCIAVEPTWIGDEEGVEVDLSDPRVWPKLQSTLQVHDILITWRDGSRDVLCWTNWGGDTGIRFRERRTGTNVTLSRYVFQHVLHTVDVARRERQR